MIMLEENMSCFQIRNLLVLFIVSFVSGNKTETWPPIDVLRKHYDMTVTDDCLQKSGVDRNEVMEFEMTTDFEHLPNSDALRAYILCYSERHEFVDKKLPKLIIGKAGNYMAEITEEEANIYMGMLKGCVKRLRGITDRSELTYQFQVCWKTNDNEHYYIFY